MADQQSYLMWPGSNSWDQRRRLAMAMMSQKRAFPKTFGEGLASIGDSIGDIAMMKYAERLAREERSDADRERGKIVLPGGATVPTSSAPQTSPQVSSDVTVDQPAPVAEVGDPVIATPPPPGPVTENGYTEQENRDLSGGYNFLDQQANLQDQRKNYYAQLQNDPASMTKMMGLMSAEEGGGAKNSSARQALAETIFNRGVSRGYGNVNQVMDPRYYQPMHDGSGSYAAHVARVNSDPAYRDQLQREIRNVAGGSNVSNLATDNASGQVAANARGNQTVAWTAPNREQFSRKDIRPDVHGAGPVASTAAWYGQTALNGPQGGAGGPAVAQAPSSPAGPASAPLAAQSPTAAAQDETLGLLSGRTGGGGDFAYPATASRSGSIATDAPDPGVSPATGAAIADTAQARRDSIAKTMTPPPAPAPAPAPAPQVAVQTDITPAPAPAPGQQVAQAAPAQAAPAPSYGPPKAVQPVMPPPTAKTEQELVNEYRAMNSPHESVRRAAAYAAAQYRQLRENTDARNKATYDFQMEQYKADRVREIEYNMKTPERDRATEKHNAEMRDKARKPGETKEIEGVLYMWRPDPNNPDGGAWFNAMPPGTNNAPNITGEQGQVLQFYQNGVRGNADLGDAKALRDPVQQALHKTVGLRGTSAEYQSQWRGALDFAAAVKRRESGAAVSAPEVQEVLDRYVPQFGASQKLIDSMALARKEYVAGLRGTLGKATPLADKFDARFAKEREGLQWLKDNPNDPRAPTVRRLLGM